MTIVDRPCTFPNCTRKLLARGYCSAHWAQWRKGKELSPIVVPVKHNCSINGCDNPSRTRDFCHTHYNNWKRRGDPLKSAPTARHGLTESIEYRIWTGMKTRCFNSNEPQYKHYGGRGITICDRWLGKYGFVNFLADMGKRPTSNSEIDRIDNDKDYSPDNCQWTTKERQQQNKRTPSKNRTGYKGIFQTVKSGNFSAKIGVDGKSIVLGTFKTFEEALKARKDAEGRYWS